MVSTWGLGSLRSDGVLLLAFDHRAAETSGAQSWRLKRGYTVAYAQSAGLLLSRAEVQFEVPALVVVQS